MQHHALVAHTGAQLVGRVRLAALNALQLPTVLQELPIHYLAQEAPTVLQVSDLHLPNAYE